MIQAVKFCGASLGFVMRNSVPNKTWHQLGIFSIVSWYGRNVGFVFLPEVCWKICFIYHKYMYGHKYMYPTWASIMNYTVCIGTVPKVVKYGSYAAGFMCGSVTILVINILSSLYVPNKEKSKASSEDPKANALLSPKSTTIAANSA